MSGWTVTLGRVDWRKAKDGVFIGAVVAVVLVVTRFGSRDTLAIAALKFVIRARMFVNVSAERRLVAHVTAVVVAIAVE